MKSATFILCSCFNIRLKERLSNNFSIFLIVTDYHHYVLRIFNFKCWKWRRIQATANASLFRLTNIYTWGTDSHWRLFRPSRVLKISQGTPSKWLLSFQPAQLSYRYLLLNHFSKPVINWLLNTHVCFAKYVIIKVETVLSLLFLIVRQSTPIVAVSLLLRLGTWRKWRLFRKQSLLYLVIRHYIYQLYKERSILLWYRNSELNVAGLSTTGNRWVKSLFSLKNCFKRSRWLNITFIAKEVSWSKFWCIKNTEYPQLIPYK